MSRSFKPKKRRKKCVIPKGPNRGFCCHVDVWCCCVCLLVLKKKNNLRKRVWERPTTALPGILWKSALAWLFPQPMFRPKCLNRSKIPGPKPVSISTHAGCLNQYKKLHTTPPAKTSWVYVTRSHRGKQSLASFSQWRKHWAVTAVRNRDKVQQRRKARENLQPRHQCRTLSNKNSTSIITAPRRWYRGPKRTNV